MERLSRHILSILRLYDSVALPGLGFLFLKKFPSRFDAEVLSLYPPMSDIFFRPTPSISDEQLLTSYTGANRLSEENAKELLSEDLNALSSALSLHGSVSLPGIGSFMVNGNTIYFVSSYHSDSFLPVIEFEKPSMYEESMAEIQEEISEDYNVGASSMASDYEVDEDPDIFDMTHELLPYEEEEVMECPATRMGDETDTTEEEHTIKYRNPDYYYIPIPKTMAKIAACIALVVVVGLVALLPFSSSRKSSSTASIVPISVTEDSTSTTKSKVQPAAAKPDSTSTEHLKVAPLDFNKEASEPSCYAVVAAFKSEAQVKKYISANKRNKKAFKVIRNGNYHLITVASATTRDELNESLPLIRSEYPDAWVFTPAQQ